MKVTDPQQLRDMLKLQQTSDDDGMITDQEEEKSHLKEENKRDMQLLLVIKEESLPEHQDWNLSVDQEDMKEEEEKLWISQQGEQLQQLEEADLTKFGLTVKSENEDEKPESSQLHQSQSDDITEAEPVASSSSGHRTLTAEDDGEHDGGPQAARNSDQFIHQKIPFDVMPLRKKRSMVENSITGHCHGWVRGAANQGIPEEPAPVIDDVPALSDSEAESTSPAPGSPIDTITDVLQLATQFSVDSDNEFPTSEAAKSQKKRKRELVTADFTEEQEEEMVDWLKAPEQECILNKKHRNYINKGLKEMLWEQKASEMGKSSDQLKKWYINMRTRFGKLKQTPSGPRNFDLTARDRWILRHFEFLSPHLVVQVKKRITLSMKAKVYPRAAPQSESDASDRHPFTAGQSDTDTSLGCRSTATDDTESSISSIAELQRQLQNKLSNTERSPLQRQKDTFADFMKEVTYTFPPTMWLRFQSEVNNLLQRYQFELHQVPPMQTQQQP